MNAELVFKKAKEFQQKSGDQAGGDLAKIEQLIANLDAIKSEADFRDTLEMLLGMLKSWPKGFTIISIS